MTGQPYCTGIFIAYFFAVSAIVFGGIAAQKTFNINFPFVFFVIPLFLLNPFEIYLKMIISYKVIKDKV